MERGINAKKYRNSTHFAGIDVALIIQEKGSCVLKIKDCYFSPKENVNGKEIAKYIIEFEEPVKKMVLNSSNINTIAKIIKSNKGLSTIDSLNIANWIGLTIELIHDETVKMKGEVVGGIRVKFNTEPIKPLNITEKKRLLETSKTIDELTKNWFSLSKEEQKNIELIKLSKQIKDKLNESI